MGMGREAPVLEPGSRSDETRGDGESFSRIGLLRLRRPGSRTGVTRHRFTDRIVFKHRRAAANQIPPNTRARPTLWIASMKAAVRMGTDLRWARS